MKKKTASQKRYDRLSELVNACLRKFSEEEMIEVFSHITRKDYIESKDTYQIISELEFNNYAVIKIESLSEQIKIEEFLQGLKDNPYQLKLIAC